MDLSKSASSANLFDTKQWTDVTFVVGKNKEKFQAHKLVLRAGSKVFDDLFNANMNQNSFEVPDVEPKEFAFLLKVK